MPYPVLAALVTPSLSAASVIGTVNISMIGDNAQLLIGKDQASGQIKFRLYDCVFEYGDFRGAYDAQHFEAFLVVASSRRDTLSLFETRN